MVTTLEASAVPAGQPSWSAGGTTAARPQAGQAGYQTYPARDPWPGTPRGHPVWPAPGRSSFTTPPGPSLVVPGRRPCAAPRTEAAWRTGHYGRRGILQSPVAV